jgi:hypothetical protein
MNHLEAKAQMIFYIGCDHIPSMAIIFFVHALHLGRVVKI